MFTHEGKSAFLQKLRIIQSVNFRDTHLIDGIFEFGGSGGKVCIAVHQHSDL